MAGSAVTQAIEVKLASAEQAFAPLDAAPFREADLAPEFERFLVEQAADLPDAAPLAVTIDLPEAEIARAERIGLGPAIGAHFARRARVQESRRRALLREGRGALAIGLAILATTLLLAFLISAWLGPRPVATLARESLVILGWVACWKPIEIFLYGWMPIAREQALMRRFAAARISLRAR
jgi:hypothetical protein